jgi:hypothetical protein
MNVSTFSSQRAKGWGVRSKGTLKLYLMKGALFDICMLIFKNKLFNYLFLRNLLKDLSDKSIPPSIIIL